MTHAEQIVGAVARLVAHEGMETFTRRDVRDRLGLSQERWMDGYTAIFQAMRVDHPGGAPSVVAEFQGIFQRVEHGIYRLTPRGEALIEQQR
jgi:hypothetical protein